MSQPKTYLVRAADAERGLRPFSHPWNPKSQVDFFQLGPATGLVRTGVNLARLAPGKESFVYHSHLLEEEWIYVLAGRGIAEVDGVEHEVGAGDFLGFPTPDVAHHLRNPFAQELVYLSGGENRQVEVADFPRLGKRMFRRRDAIEIYDLKDGKPFGPLT
jgi:uncharacterized cupin superfamily protein